MINPVDEFVERWVLNPMVGKLVAATVAIPVIVALVGYAS